MKRAIAVAIALLACAACGDPEPVGPAGEDGGFATPASGGANQPPDVQSLEITPNPAGASDPLALELKAWDPDRDKVTTRIEWYKNGTLDEELTESSVPGGTFSRGDRIHAIVYISDGTHEVTRSAGPVSIENALPNFRGARITPPGASAADVLAVEVGVEDADQDSVELSYRWYKNGTLLPAVTGPRLTPGGARRGDKIMVEVSATDGSDTTEWASAGTVVLANAKPSITSQPGYEMGPTGVYSYPIQAKDADGDVPLRFELVSGPPGMTVDDATGVVSWTVPQDVGGNKPIEVAVSDGYGGRVTQQWVLSVDWNQTPQPPANATQSAAPTEDARQRQTAPPAPAEESPAENQTLDEDETPAPRAAPAQKPTAAKAPARAKPEDEEDDSSAPYEAEETEEEEEF